MFWIRKYFWVVSTVCIFLCGMVLFVAYELSNHAAWSILVSAVNGSPWEYSKPFSIVYIFWTFIELSCLRPSLLRFVSAKIMGLALYVFFANGVMWLAQTFSREYMLMFLVIFVCILLTNWLSYGLYQRSVRCEIFFVPLIFVFWILFGMILFCTVCPMTFPIFVE